MNKKIYWKKDITVEGEFYISSTSVFIVADLTEDCFEGDLIFKGRVKKVLRNKHYLNLIGHELVLPVKKFKVNSISNLYINN